MISHLHTKLILITLSLFSFSQSYAKTNCETYSHIELKEKYNANFLNKDYQGCFSYSIDPENRKAPEAMLMIRLGDHLTNINASTSVKIAYEAFTSFVNSNRVNKAVSDDVDQNLNNIRSEAKLAAQKIDKDLLNFDRIYNDDAISQLKQNQLNIRNDAKLLEKKVEILNQQVPTLATNSSEVVFPSDLVKKTLKNLGPIEKEKQKWENLKNKETIPFRSLEKISQGKNIALADQLIKEIKTERYNQLGLTKVERLPTLRKIQRYESRENLYDQKLAIINNGPDLTRAYSKSELQTIKTIANELKNESERSLVTGKLDEANDSIDLAYMALDIATSLPLIASGRGLYELYTGKSLIDGHELTKVEKAMAGGMILIDLTPASVLARGAGLINILGKAGNRLTQRGIVKAGLEESLNVSAKYAEAFVTNANALIQQGAIKYETIKTVVEHKLFFNFIEDEAYFASRAYADKLLHFESISTMLTKKGLEVTPNLNRYLSNTIQFKGEALSNELLIGISNNYLHYESKFKSLSSLGVEDLIVTRVSKKPYSPFDTSKGWHASNIATDHRFSMKGESALYTVIGNNDNSINAAFAEIEITRDMVNSIFTESKTFSGKKILDLTDPKNLEILGITEEKILGNYTLPQILGHLAKMNQYDAIITSGTKKYIYGTDVTLEYYKNYIILRGF